MTGSDGYADDGLAQLGDWGFSLQDATGVHIWHGREDANVPIFNGLWLGHHLPGATLRTFENEGHVSIMSHLLEIINQLGAAGH